MNRRFHADCLPCFSTACQHLSNLPDAFPELGGGEGGGGGVFAPDQDPAFDFFEAGELKGEFHFAGGGALKFCEE